MPTLSRPDLDSDQIYPVFNLADPDLRLDCSNDPWNLDPDKDLAMVVGRDVISGGTMRPEGGRWPVGSSVPIGDRPVVSADPSSIYGRTNLLYRGNFRNHGGTTSTLQRTGAWPANVVGAYLIKNEDERAAPTEIAVITGRTTTSTTNDTITFSPPFANVWAGYENFHIFYPGSYDQRGIWLTNGRKFWLLRDGTATLYLDLGDNAYLGTAWRGTSISRTRYLFVAPTQIPRIIDISDTTSDTTDSVSRMPGLFPPGAPASPAQATAATYDRGIYGEFMGYMNSTGYAGAVSPGTLTRIKVRGINRYTGAESELVQVRNIDAGTHPHYGNQIIADQFAFKTDFAFNDGVVEVGSQSVLKSKTLAALCYQWVGSDKRVLTTQGYTGEYYLSDGPGAGLAPSTSLVYDTVPANFVADDVMSTHALAVGVTLPVGTGISGYIVTRRDELTRGYISVFTDGESLLVPVDPRWTDMEIWRTDDQGGSYYLERRVSLSPNYIDPLTNDTSGHPLKTLMYRVPLRRFTCEMGNAELIGQQEITANDLMGGRLPPICKRAGTLNGVTICAGAASATNKTATAYAMAFYADAGDYTASSGRVTKTNCFTAYTPKTGDIFEILAPFTHAGQYVISSRVSASAIDLSSGPAGNLTGTLYGRILRPYSIAWPTLDSEEEIAYSRPDKFAPESFMSTRLKLSDTGDVFMGMVRVRNAMVVVMRSGLHVLRYTGSAIEKQTVGLSGLGTPWDRSVVAHEDSAIWATPQGPRLLRVSEEADVSGQSSQVGWLDPDNRLRQWFADAYAAGHTIIASVDPLNQCVRFKRIGSNSFYQALQYSYRNQLWTFLDDDMGDWFCLARAVQSSSDADEHLYSVGARGESFLLNYYGTTWPYAGKVVQGTIGVTYTYSNPVISGPVGSFNDAMLGESVRIRSQAPPRDGAVYTIVLVASDGSGIRLDRDAGLQITDEFIIGAVRFRLRSAPMRGAARPHFNKTVYAAQVVAIPGIRTSGDAHTSDGKITLRTYRNYGETAEYDDDKAVPIFHDENDVALVDVNRVSSVAGQGSSLQVEIEHIEARSDFKLAEAAVTIKEESNMVNDQSTTA